MLSSWLSLFGFLTLVNLYQAQQAPNIVLFLLDDQDVLINGMTAFPKTMQLFSSNTLEFTNAFASTPVCCVSRGSILTGRYVHNSQIYNNSIYGGCGSLKFIKEQEPYSYAAYLQQADYRTFFSGKYLNLYGLTDEMPFTHIPKGWTDWYALIGDAVYYDYSLSIKGRQTEYHGFNGDVDYLPFVMANKAKMFLQSVQENTPFLISLCFPSGHSPWTPPDDLLHILEDESLTTPKLKNFNYFNEDESNNDKGPVLRMQKKMSEAQILMADKVYRGRHGTFMAVDDIIYDLYQQIEAMGQIENTYFIYASDHGFHIGQYGMWFGKKLLYETDLRIPFYIHGPGVGGQNKQTSKTALTIDIAPTIVDLAIGSVPDSMDGESLLTYFNLNEMEELEIFNSKQEFLVEYHGATDYNHQTLEPLNKRIIHCPAHTDEIDKIECDLWNNTFKCIRIIDGSKLIASIENDNIGEILCEYTCYDHKYEETECEQGSVEANGEYYNLDIDPWQLHNGYFGLTDGEIAYFKGLIDTHLNCHSEVCRELRTTINDANILNYMQSSDGILISNDWIVLIGCGVFVILRICILLYFKYGCCLRFCYRINKEHEYTAYTPLAVTHNLGYNTMNGTFGFDVI